MLLAGAVLAVLAALYVFLWEPGLAARRSLAESLPRLRAQLEDMRKQRSEIVALRRELGGATRGGDAAALLRASAAQAPFAVSAEHIEALPEGRALLRAEGAPFAAWLSWVEGLQRELGIRVEQCRISALERPGVVRIEARFAPAAAGPR